MQARQRPVEPTMPEPAAHATVAVRDAMTPPTCDSLTERPAVAEVMKTHTTFAAVVACATLGFKGDCSVNAKFALIVPDVVAGVAPAAVAMTVVPV